MSYHPASLAWFACALGIGSGAVCAQSSGDLLGTGIRAYRNLEFEAAAGLLRGEVARLGASEGPDTNLTKALVYLGAADLFRGRRDSAIAVFRRLIILDPRYRPDRLIFPPEVTTTFDGARQQTKALVIAVPRDTEIAAGAGALSAWLVASSFQTVDVTLRYPDGGPFRVLYYGPITDSLNVKWDGLDPVGQAAVVDRLLLRVASRGPSGDVVSILQVPLELRVTRADTLAWPRAPADSQLLPERAGGGAARRALMGGLLLSAAVVSLPVIVGGAETSSGPRIAVAGTVGLASLVGYVLHRPGRPLEANMRANQTARQAWAQRVAVAKAENARRRGDTRLAIRAGKPTAVPARGS